VHSTHCSREAGCFLPWFLVILSCDKCEWPEVFATIFAALGPSEDVGVATFQPHSMSLRAYSESAIVTVLDAFHDIGNMVFLDIFVLVVTVSNSYELESCTHRSHICSASRGYYAPTVFLSRRESPFGRSVLRATGFLLARFDDIRPIAGLVDP
jgi:hypothetical protein